MLVRVYLKAEFLSLAMFNPEVFAVVLMR